MQQISAKIKPPNFRLSATETIYGAGTDLALETPPAIQTMLNRWAGQGFTGIYWREGAWRYTEPRLSEMRFNPQSRPMVLRVIELNIELAQTFDVIGTAKQMTEDLGMKFSVLHEVWNDGTPAGPDPPYWPQQWQYMHDHPEVQVVDRSGNPQYGVGEFAYADLRAVKVAECVDLVNRYNLTNLMISLRTEMALTMPAPARGDIMGYNAPVAAAMQSLYGVNILTDPRFDTTSGSFNIYDPMVENWRVLRGGYLTQFLRELRAALDAVNPAIKIGILCNRGDYLGPPLGNMKQDWRTWVVEGLVDVLLMGYGLGSTGQPGYLCDVQAGIGVLPWATVFNYINASSHPEIELIRAGGVYEANTDGYMTDTMSWDGDLPRQQRAGQIQDNLTQYGYIGFLEQNFDSFPAYTTPWCNGGQGDGRYFPGLNRSGGFWSVFGDGTDLRAVVQDEVMVWGSGHAVKVARGGGALTGNRNVGSIYVDDALSSGYVMFEFRLYRPDSNSSITMHMRNHNVLEWPVGLWVRGSSQDGRVYVTTWGVYIETDHYLEPGLWHHVVMEVDLERKRYSIFTGANQETVIASELVISGDLGFDEVSFSPAEAQGNVSYLDNVVVRWSPTAMPGIQRCGDSAHPYPPGDLNQDCIVDLNDWTLFVDNWLRCTRPDCD